jgi:hypothetical protein
MAFTIISPATRGLVTGILHVTVAAPGEEERREAHQNDGDDESDETEPKSLSSVTHPILTSSVTFLVYSIT